MVLEKLEVPMDITLFLIIAWTEEGGHTATYKGSV